MNCERVQPHLPTYADGELPPDLVASVAEHVDACAPCADEVRRWRALRVCARRAVNAAAVPEALAQRMRGRLRKATPLRARMLLGISASGAIAAAVVLAVFFYTPREVAATPVAPEQFATIHRKCAGGLHDSLHVAGNCAHVCGAKLSAEQKFTVMVPDLSADDYELKGACPCFPDKSLNVVHVFYQHKTDKSRLLSVFTVNRPVAVAGCGSQFGKGCQKTRRSYQVTHDQGLTLVGWCGKRCGRSFVLCGQLEAPLLIGMADDLKMASIEVTVPAHLAMTQP